MMGPERSRVRTWFALAALQLLIAPSCMGNRGGPAASPRPNPDRVAARPRATSTTAPQPTGTPTVPVVATATTPAQTPAPRRNIESESAARSTSAEAYIPEGTYVLGPYDLCSKLNPETGKLEGPGPACEEGYYPAKPVELKAYFIDRAEVTLSDYEKCVKARGCPRITAKMLQEHNTGCNRPEAIKERLSDGPMSCVTHQEAETYCKWKGERLPTDAEWEVAARGGDSRTFPWGDEFPTKEGDTFTKFCRWGRPCSVRKFGPYGPFRLYGMESGVREWTSSPACESYPKDCAAEQFGLKGGMYMDGTAADWDVFSLGGVDGATRWIEVGFRCARDAS